VEGKRLKAESREIRGIVIRNLEELTGKPRVFHAKPPRTQRRKAKAKKNLLVCGHLLSLFFSLRFGVLGGFA
jgi:hypothetical protein